MCSTILTLLPPPLKLPPQILTWASNDTTSALKFERIARSSRGISARSLNTGIELKSR